jgi:hypothetical protein
MYIYINIYIHRSLQAAGSTVTWSVALSVADLNRIQKSNGAASAYTSLSNQLNNAMQGTFLTNIQKISTSFNSVTGTTITINAFTVKTISTPTTAPTASPTIIAVIPSITLTVATPSLRTQIDLSLVLNKARIVASDVSGGFVYCIAMPEGELTSIGKKFHSIF